MILLPDSKPKGLELLSNIVFGVSIIIVLAVLVGFAFYMLTIFSKKGRMQLRVNEFLDRKVSSVLIPAIVSISLLTAVLNVAFAVPPSLTKMIETQAEIEYNVSIPTSSLPALSNMANKTRGETVSTEISDPFVAQDMNTNSVKTLVMEVNNAGEAKLLELSSGDNWIELPKA